MLGRLRTAFEPLAKRRPSPSDGVLNLLLEHAVSASLALRLVYPASTLPQHVELHDALLPTALRAALIEMAIAPGTPPALVDVGVECSAAAAAEAFEYDEDEDDGTLVQVPDVCRASAASAASASSATAGGDSPPPACRTRRFACTARLAWFVQADLDGPSSPRAFPSVAAALPTMRAAPFAPLPSPLAQLDRVAFAVGRLHALVSSPSVAVALAASVEHHANLAARERSQPPPPSPPPASPPAPPPASPLDLVINTTLDADAAAVAVAVVVSTSTAEVSDVRLEAVGDLVGSAHVHVTILKDSGEGTLGAAEASLGGYAPASPSSLVLGLRTPHPSSACSPGMAC